MTDRLDPGAYIGSEPELEEETIPGGVQPGDERVAAYGSAPGAEGEPDRLDLDGGDVRDSSDVVDGAIGDASLNDPATSPDQGANLAALPGVDATGAVDSA